jgi:ABC-2 type transport system ATP-binding protein
VVLSTHVLSEIESVCGRVIILHRGKIVAQDRIADLHLAGRRVRVVVARPPADLAAQLGALPGVAQVRSDRPGVYEVDAQEDVRERVAAALVPHGLLELAAPGALEEVFLRLTGKDTGTDGEAA